MSKPSLNPNSHLKTMSLKPPIQTAHPSPHTENPLVTAKLYLKLYELENLVTVTFRQYKHNKLEWSCPTTECQMSDGSNLFEFDWIVNL